MLTFKSVPEFLRPILCMNGQILHLPRLGVKFPTPPSGSKVKFPTPGEGEGVNCPWYARGGDVDDVTN